MSDRFTDFCAQLGPEFDPAFIKLHVGTDDLDELVEFVWERDDLSPLVEAGMKPLFRNKFFSAILKKRALQKSQHDISPTVTPRSPFLHTVEQTTVSETSETLTHQEELTLETESDAPTDEDSKRTESSVVFVVDKRHEADSTEDGAATHLDSKHEETPKEKETLWSRFGEYDDLFPSMMTPTKKRTVPQAAHTGVSSDTAWAYRNQKGSNCKDGMARTSGTYDAGRMSSAASSMAAPKKGTAPQTAHTGVSGRKSKDSTAGTSRTHDAGRMDSAVARGGYGRNRSAVGELHGPQAGGRVHFSGCVMWDSQVCNYCSKPYEEDTHSEYVGVGKYPHNDKAFPKAIGATFDSVAVDAGTRVVIYSKPNFQGKVLWDRVGPALVVNVKWKTEKWPFFRGKQYSDKFLEDWSQPLNSIFPPAVREFSCSDMHEWNSGSVIISDGEAIPNQLDAVQEYRALSNQRC